MKHLLLTLVAQLFLSMPLVMANSFTDKFYTNWSTAGKCVLWNKGTNTFVREVSDLMCDSSTLELPLKIEWTAKGACGFFNNGSHLGGVSHVHCSDKTFASSFDYKWSSDSRCNIYHRDNLVGSVDEHHCGELPPTHHYGWVENGNCGIFVKDSASNDKHIRKVNDVYCGDLHERLLFSWSKGATCNIYKTEINSEGEKDSVYMKQVPDWNCGKLDSNFKYSWTKGGECHIFDENDKSIRKVNLSHCEIPSSILRYAWTASGSCGLYKISSGELLHDRAPLESCEQDLSFQFDWTAYGQCQLMNLATGVRKTVEDSFCPGYPLTEEYFLDNQSQCHLWNTYDGFKENRYIGIASITKCKNITDIKEIPETQKSFAALREMNADIFENGLSFLSKLNRKTADINDLFPNLEKPKPSSMTAGGGYDPGDYHVPPPTSSTPKPSSGSSSSSKEDYPSYVYKTDGGAPAYHSGGGVYHNPSTGSSFKLPSGGSGFTYDSQGGLVTCVGGFCS